MTAGELYLAQVDGDRLVGRAHFTRQRRVISMTLTSCWVFAMTRAKERSDFDMLAPQSFLASHRA